MKLIAVPQRNDIIHYINLDIIKRFQSHGCGVIVYYSDNTNSSLDIPIEEFVRLVENVQQSKEAKSE